MPITSLQSSRNENGIIRVVKFRYNFIERLSKILTSFFCIYIISCIHLFCKFEDNRTLLRFLHIPLGSTLDFYLIPRNVFNQLFKMPFLSRESMHLDFRR